MAYISNWFHLYETEESFKLNEERGLINPNSICFINETGQINTQKSFFGIDKKDYAQLKNLIENHDTVLKRILGIEGAEVNDGIINTLADFKKFLEGFSEDDNLQQVINSLETTINNQIAEVERNLLDRISNLNTKVDTNYHSLLESISSINTDINDINSSINTHSEDISNIKESIANHIEDYNSLKSSFDTFKSYTEGKFTAVNNNISTLSTSLNNVKNSIESLASTTGIQIEGIKKDIDTIKDNISEINTGIGNVNVGINETNSKVAALDTKLNNKVEELTTTINNNKSEADENYTSLNQKIDSTKTEITNELDAHIALIGAANGITPLDNNSKVPAAYLPSYVDDILEFDSIESFPSVGESGKIYTAIDTNKTYRWSGTIYTELSKSLGLGETSSTAYPGNLGKTTTDALASHKANQENPHNVTKAQVGLGNVDNTSDKNKPISDAAQNLFNTKVNKVEGKGLSTNDYTDTDKSKVDNIPNKVLCDAGLYVGKSENKIETFVVTVDHNIHNDPNNIVAEASPKGVLVLEPATSTQAGLMSTTDRTKLDGIEEGAQVNTITGVKGASETTYRTGNVNITKDNIGLSNVDNTSDLNKPVSTATQNELNNRVTYYDLSPSDEDVGLVMNSGYTLGSSWGKATAKLDTPISKIVSITATVNNFEFESGRSIDSMKVRVFFDKWSTNVPIAAISFPEGYTANIDTPWIVGTYMWIDGIHLIALHPEKVSSGDTRQSFLFKEIPLSRLSILTQAEYDALANKDAKTLYVVP